jgi:hypothetical protein
MEEFMKRAVCALLLGASTIGLAARANANPSMAISNESGSVIYTDLGNGADAVYIVFQLTNNGTAAADVWASLDTSASSIISNVGSGLHQLKYEIPTGAHGTDPVAQTGLGAGQTKGVLFLVKASSTTGTPQTLTVNLSATNGGGNDLGSASFQFTVEDTIKANANKVNTVITIPTNPAPGQLGRITVTGCTGVVGSQHVLYFSPVSADTWPADNFEFVSSDIDITGYPNTPYRDVALIPTADVASVGNANDCYDEVFVFEINGPGDGSTTPQNYIASGTQIKHTTNTSGSFSVTIPPPGCGSFSAIDISPTSLPNVTDGNAYSQQLSASGGPAGTYTFSASGLPGWLNLSSSGLLSGTPTPSDDGSVSFTVTATDTPTSGTDPTCTGQRTYNFSVDPSVTLVNVPTLGYPAMALLALALAGAALLLIRRS